MGERSGHTNKKGRWQDRKKARWEDRLMWKIQERNMGASRERRGGTVLGFYTIHSSRNLIKFHN